MERIGVLGELLAQLVILLLPALLLLQLQLPLLGPRARRGRVTRACPSCWSALGVDGRPNDFSFWTPNVTGNHGFVGQGEPDVDINPKEEPGRHLGSSEPSILCCSQLAPQELWQEVRGSG